ADTIVDSQNQSAEKSNKALVFLKEKGVKEADLKTINYYTNTKYKNQVGPCAYEAQGVDGVARPVSSIEPARIAPCTVTNQVPSGYETFHTIEVKVRDIKDNPKLVGDLVAGLGQIGVK